jgi:hypothetical protein
VDLNNDGHRDILSGSYSRMEESMAGLFQVLWGTSGGKFKKAEVLKGTDKEPLIIPIKGKDEQLQNICTRPWAVDWNGDGKLDLVVGNFAGSFYLFKGEGKGKFAPKPEPLKAGSGSLQIEGHHSDPFVIDWDGDGDIDILSGADKGGVQWAENTAGRGKPPAFEGFTSLIKSGRLYEMGELVSEQELTDPSGSTRVWADDVNGDGKLDILVGDSITLVSLAKGVSKKQYDEKFKKWKEAYSAASKAMDEAKNDDDRQAAQKHFTKVFQQRTEFMKEERTGYVWLYQRK